MGGSVSLVPRLLVSLLLAFPVAATAFSYSETFDGDLSGNNLLPTALVAAQGSNLLSGSTVGGDLEYLRITLPAGTQLAALVLNSVTSSDDLIFIAAQEGTTDVDAYRTQMAGFAEGLALQLLGSTDAARQLGTALGDFVTGRKGAVTITITSKDPNGIPLALFMAAQNDPSILTGQVDVVGTSS